MGSEGIFIVQIMEDVICEHATNFCWVGFAGKMPARNLLYNILWVQENERRARIVNPAEKNMDAAGIEPVTSRCKTSTKATNPWELVDIESIILFHLAELATSEFWLNLQHSRRPKQTLVKYASLIYEPGATKLSFFLQQWPQKGAFSLTVWKNVISKPMKKLCLQLWNQSQEYNPTKSHNNSADVPSWGILR